MSLQMHAGDFWRVATFTSKDKQVQKLSVVGIVVPYAVVFFSTNDIDPFWGMVFYGAYVPELCDQMTRDFDVCCFEMHRKRCA